MQRYLFLLLLTLLFSATSHAQGKQKKLDRLFTDLEGKGDFNGSVLVARGDEILYERYLGYANIETEQAINGHTVFELASMGKQFTAMGIMILAERKQLTYDDLVGQHLKDFPYPTVTIRHLLNMASGIPEYFDFAGQLGVNQIPTNQDLLAFYQAEKPALQFEPYTAFSYANINYVILASIIEEVSQQDFAAFLKQHIFDPAGMSATRSFTDKYTAGKTPENYAFPYVRVNGKLVKPAENADTQYVIAASRLEGDGSIVSTPYDLLKWTKALQENLIVSAKTLQEAYQAPTFKDGQQGAYGFGMYVGKDRVWHWGGWPGVQTAYTRYLDEGTVAIYLKNIESNNWSWVGQFEKLVSK